MAGLRGACAPVAGLPGGVVGGAGMGYDVWTGVMRGWCGVCCSGGLVFAHGHGTVPVPRAVRITGPVSRSVIVLSSL